MISHLYSDPHDLLVGLPAGKLFNRACIQKLDRGFAGPRRLLVDVGTGRGLNVQADFVASFARAYLVEPHPDRFRRLQTVASVYPNVAAVQSDAQSLTGDLVPFGQADFVMAKYVVQHIPTWQIQPFFNRLIDLARPGGQIGLFVATAGDGPPYFVLTARGEDIEAYPAAIRERLARRAGTGAKRLAIRSAKRNSTVCSALHGVGHLSPRGTSASTKSSSIFVPTSARLSA